MTDHIPRDWYIWVYRTKKGFWQVWGDNDRGPWKLRVFRNREDAETYARSLLGKYTHYNMFDGQHLLLGLH